MILGRRNIIVTPFRFISTHNSSKFLSHLVAFAQGNNPLNLARKSMYDLTTLDVKTFEMGEPVGIYSVPYVLTGNQDEAKSIMPFPFLVAEGKVNYTALVEASKVKQVLSHYRSNHRDFDVWVQNELQKAMQEENLTV